MPQSSLRADDATRAPSELQLRIISAQHLPKPTDGDRFISAPYDRHDPQRLHAASRKPPSSSAPTNVYCVLECWQGTGLSEEPLTFRTRVAEQNGLFPSWDQQVAWEIDQPHAAMLRLSVYHKGILKDELLGTEAIPLRAARCGYRAVFLRSPKGPELELGSLLVEMRLRTLNHQYC